MGSIFVSRNYFIAFVTKRFNVVRVALMLRGQRGKRQHVWPESKNLNNKLSSLFSGWAMVTVKRKESSLFHRLSCLFWKAKQSHIIRLPAPCPTVGIQASSSLMSSLNLIPHLSFHPPTRASFLTQLSCLRQIVDSSTWEGGADKKRAVLCQTDTSDITSGQCHSYRFHYV